MSEEEMDRRLKQIGDLAKRQREGPYDARSDAVQALACIETLTLLLVEMWNAQRATTASLGRIIENS